MKKLFSIRLVMVPALIAGGLVGCESTPRRPGVDLSGGTIAGPGEPGQAEVLRAESLQRRGDREAALAIFERAIQRNPELTVAYLGAGDIYRELGDYSSAEQRYAKAAELEPRNFDAQYFHGLSLQLLDRFAEAVRAYLRALSIRPGDFDANLNLATAYLQLGEPRQAQVYALRAVRLNGQSGAARANLGAVYAALDEHEAAVAEFQQAAELMELNPQLLLNLADSLSRVGRHAESINTLDQVLRIEPSPEAYERLGAARFRMRAYEDAAAAFGQALDLDANHYPAINGLAVCRLNDYLWSDRTDREAYDEAVELLRRSLRIRPNQPKIIELLRRYG
ncbi:MAG: tetratricopeptide repeat protein [Phycisphaerales bacterium JB037]